MPMLDADKLRQVLDYDPGTGVFRWKMKIAQRCCVGEIVGTVRHDNSRIVSIFGKRHYVYRLAFLWMTGEWPPEEVDHINCDRGDNRWNNLRLANQEQNTWNRRDRKNKKPPKGVSWDKQAKKYRARITKNKTIFLGHFQTIKDARVAYASAAKKHFGEYARS